MTLHLPQSSTDYSLYTNTRNISLRIFSTNSQGVVCQCQSERIDYYHSSLDFKPFEFEYDRPASMKYCTICVSVKSFSIKWPIINLLRTRNRKKNNRILSLFFHIRMSMKSIVHTSCDYHVITLNEFGLYGVFGVRGS